MLLRAGGPRERHPAWPPGACDASVRLRGDVDGSVESLSKEMINLLQILEYRDRMVVVVERTEDVAGWIDRLRAEAREAADAGLTGYDHRHASGDRPNPIVALGFDTETQPKFTKGGRDNPVALIQVGSLKTAVLFRVCAMAMESSCGGGGGHGQAGSGSGSGGVPSALLDLLADPHVLKVGVGVVGDVDALQTRVPGFTDNGSFVDVSPLYRARFPAARRLGLRPLTALIVKKRLAKAQQMANWAQARMTHPMVRYASADAFVGLELWQLALEAPDGSTTVPLRHNEAVPPHLLDQKWASPPLPTTGSAGEAASMAGEAPFEDRGLGRGRGRGRGGRSRSGGSGDGRRGDGTGRRGGGRGRGDGRGRGEGRGRGARGRSGRGRGRRGAGKDSATE
eukprot:m.263463 g.263463  ORF g.263463 m.263463 type:complete len:396 (-) comp26708_c0_seq1:3187-4374(-)